MKKIFIPIFIILICIPVVLSYKNGPREANIVFVGDMFFDRHIRKAMYREDGDYIFSCIGDFLKSSDMVVGNLEGPVTANASVSITSIVGSPDNFRFTFPTNVPNLLKENNILALSLGNNHIGNFGREGIESTHKYLSEAGVGYFGGLKGDEEILRKEVNGNKLSFIAYNEFGGGSVESVEEKIEAEKQEGRFVIVFAHWGDEYAKANTGQKNKAKSFAKAGADFIVGAHPHVIQENEVLEVGEGKEVRKVPVYYSLGNFMFDQYWEESVRTGLALNVKIKGEIVEITEQKTYLERDGRTCLK